jgi:putative glutamine amidotransferase
MTRPTIGVTGPDRGGAAAWIATRIALQRAGAKAVRVTPSRPRDLTQLDGLVLGGGADVDPALYGETVETLGEAVDAVRDDAGHRPRHRRASIVLVPLIFTARKLLEEGTRAGPDPARDELEQSLLAGAVERRLPVLGICRGAQLMNVWFGGTLHQDIREFYVETPQLRTVLPKKVVHLEKGSHLSRLMGATECVVNALHDQAIEDLGDGLAVVGREGNGIVQAIEHPDLPFMIGVQWHPEYIPHHRRQRALFDGLVRCAAVRLAS